MRGLGRLQRVARRISNKFVSRAIILLYHRVAELPIDPQRLSVSRSHFVEHLQVIEQYGQTIPVTTLSKALQNRGRFIIVTFDDGYADNLYNAKPLLERYDVPATVFVTTGYVGAKREFWYDDLERIFLHAAPLPETLRLEINGCAYEWELGSPNGCSEEAYVNARHWNISRKDNSTARHGVYRSLFEILHPLLDEQRQEILGLLASWAGMDEIQRPTHRTLAAQELIRLANGGLIEIGSHTVSHPVLAVLPLAAQTDEISQSKTHLEEILGHRVRSFAYPFGGRSHYTEETVAMVREAGFESACSNFTGTIRRNTDPWQLPRFLVRDWDGDEFTRNLRGWLDA